MNLSHVLDAYNLQRDSTIIKIGHGLIHSTWIVKCNTKQYILQQINTNVFKSPEDIEFNCNELSAYVSTKSKLDFQIVTSLTNINGKKIFESEGQKYRLFPFIKNSHTISKVEKDEQAYEASKQFGTFARNFAGFDPLRLKITLPDFHNLTLRYDQFLTSLKIGNQKRINSAKTVIKEISDHHNIVRQYRQVMLNPAFKLRVMHHDTKISNVLFDQNGKGICVIDLDTVMPGYFISDVGDMMRTYISPANEEEQDFTKIHVRKEMYEAIVAGYLDTMADELTEIEKSNFLYAGKFLIYMQALRFLTDYFNDDVYYGALNESHNLLRAANQMNLLNKLCEFEKSLI